MQLTANILLSAAGAFLIGNAAVSLAVASWIRQVQDKWWLNPLANRWGAGRVRLFLIANGLLSGLLGIAAVAASAYLLVTRNANYLGI